MLKRSLALGALMAFVITGQAWAESKINEKSLVCNEDTTIEASYSNEESSSDIEYDSEVRVAAIGYTAGTDNKITIADGKTLTVKNELTGTHRNYGIAVSSPINGASLSITGGANSVVDLDVEVANRAHGVRNNFNGTLNINVGHLDVNVKMTGNSNVTYGMDVWQGSTTNINTESEGTTKFYVEATKGSVYGIQGWHSTDTYTNAKGEKVPYSNKNAVVNINDLDLTVKSTHQNSDQAERDTEDGPILLRGINLHETTMNLVGDTTKITLTNDGKFLSSAIVALQGNHSDAPTVLNFNAATTTLTATGGNGNNAVVGVSASGENSQINFNGDSVLVDIDGGNASVIGVNAQYKGNTVTGLEKTSIKVDVESKTDENVVGIGAHIFSGSAGNIDFAGDTTVIAKNNGSGSAYGVYAEAGGNIDLEGNVNIEAKGNGEVYSILNQGGNIAVGGAEKDVILVGDVAAQGPGGKVEATFGTPNSKFDGKVETVGNANTTLNFNAGIWNLKGASTLTNATFDAGSILVIEGKTFDAKEGSTDYALNGVGSDSKLTVKDGAKLTVTGIKETTYNIAKGFNTLEGTIVDETTTKYWDVNDVNTLMQGVLWNNGENGLQLEVYAKPADTLSEEMNVSEFTAQSIANVTTAAQAAEKKGIEGKADGTGDEKAVALINAMSSVDSKVAGQVYEAVSKMAEAGGNSATAASIVKNVTGVTNDRLSFNCGHSAPHKGGHGVGLFEEGSGADVWVEYVHGKDKVEDMPSTAGASSYEGQYNGIIMGVDFNKVNKFQSGIAFNYGEGDTNSVDGSAARTHSDYDFWGIGYYGSIHNDDSNVIFDIGYAKTDSDVENTNATGVNFKASPETTTWTAGVKLEKLYQNENVQIVPYTGLRFMSIDPKDYSTECASTKYQMERQNVWLLPLGVSIRQEIANDNGWTVSPRVDLSYIWAFGDTDSEMEFSTLGTKTNIGYEVMDDGSVLGLVGIEAHKGQWGFGVSYSYQKGDHSESKKWFIDANYSF